MIAVSLMALDEIDPPRFVLLLVVPLAVSTGLALSARRSREPLTRRVADIAFVSAGSLTLFVVIAGFIITSNTSLG
ncbi:MAG: hypothetical protein AAFY08_14575 [Planctomycetota bacterium]